MKTILLTTSSFGKYDKTPLERLETSGFLIVPNPFGRKLSEEEVFSLIQTHKPVGIIAGVEPLTEKVLQEAPGLKLISRCGIGLDSVDLSAAERLGIRVTNTPDAPTIPVAELTVGMILSLLRKIHYSDAGIRAGGWQRPMGNLISGKTVGIIGCGRIGSYVIRLLSSFGCNLLGYDVYPHSDPRQYLPSELPDLLDNSDIVSLHIPYSTENHHFIDRDKIQMMKKGAFLINTARGGLVDEDAVQFALASGHLGGAALDSFEQEPYSGPLIESDGMLLTGHIGSYAIEGRVIMENEAVDNLFSELKKAGIRMQE